MNLAYNMAYHLRCELALRSGRKITLQSLDQTMTYAGLLEGHPDRELNDVRVKSALRGAQKHCFAGANPHIIVPPRRDYLRTPGDMERARASWPERVPEWLPMVQCIGSFTHARTVRDHTKHISVLTLVWFQDEFAMPIMEPAFSKLLELDWDSLAQDVEL